MRLNILLIDRCRHNQEEASSPLPEGTEEWRVLDTRWPAKGVLTDRMQKGREAEIRSRAQTSHNLTFGVSISIKKRREKRMEAGRIGGAQALCDSKGGRISPLESGLG